MWEDEFYIFDSQTISEKDFDEKVEYEDYQAFADSMTGEEVTDRLNKYNKEYLDCHTDVLRLEKENEQLKEELDYFRAKSGSCEEGLFQNDREIAKLEKENKGLKQLIDLFAQDICDLTEILSKNQLDYKLHSDVENFIIKWGVRIE